jgi:hypothetical protein
MPIHLNDMQQMARSAYPGNTSPKIGDFTLFRSTPTLKFYSDGKTIVVSVRGTNDARDAAADAQLVIGKLNESDRYKADLHTLTELQKVAPPRRFNYIAVGHSLGGAIIDRFLRAGLIRNALSYNPAPEPQEMGGNPLHRRIYHKDDPIYTIAGRFIPGVEVRSGNDSFWNMLLKYAVPGGTFINAIHRHLLGAFKGGFYRI